MPIVVGVRMRFSSKDLYFDPADSSASLGDHVIVNTERGTEIGLVTRDPFEIDESELKKELKPVIRIANDEDLARAEELAEKSDAAMPVFRRLVKRYDLDMKPVGVDFLFDGDKGCFYFSAEERFDFRELVRDLATEFKCRVDMRQLGVRDEARLMGGYAPCGQELCCVRFNGEFSPVSIRMAKEQDLPLNSAKVSGVCGRLMCCLRYEFDAYKDFKQRAPKRNAVIDTPLGKAKIVEYNTPRELVVLRLENGKSITIPLKDMTCSEAAYKRSSEQGIPLRPDTVTREALESIGTAQIALQLAELDRANDPDAYTLDDSLVSAEYKHEESRRTTSNSSPRRTSTSASHTRTPHRDSNSTADSRSPRRERRTTTIDTNVQQRRETRTKRTRQSVPATPQRTDTSSTEHSRRTHRHRTAQENSRATQPSSKPINEENPRTTQQPRRKHRRPGDKGGSVV